MTPVLHIAAGSDLPGDQEAIALTGSPSRLIAVFVVAWLSVLVVACVAPHR